MVFEFEFLKRSKHLKPANRREVVNWLMQVHACMNVEPETLHTAIYLLDSYAAKKSDLKPENHQLAGFAALVIAHKCEEVGPPEIGLMSMFTDEYYERPDVAKMEREILATVGFSVTRPLPVTFLRRFADLAAVSISQMQAKFVEMRE